jgi:hypothetical protein
MLVKNLKLAEKALNDLSRVSMSEFIKKIKKKKR